MDWHVAESDIKADCEAYGMKAKGMKRDALAEYLAEMTGADLISALVFFWQEAGSPALDTSATGYCQGDYADVGVFHLPKWCEYVGAPAKPGKAATKDMQGSAKVWAAWAYGDVYGYVIEDDDGNDLDSCFGFYGSDPEWSGLAGAAISAADYHNREIAERMADDCAASFAPMVEAWAALQSA
jgi:hypothetical protein